MKTLDKIIIEKLMKENCKLRNEIEELKQRLKWIEYLTKGAVHQELIKIIKNIK